MKIIVKLLLAIVLIIIVAISAIFVFVDPNDYTPQIRQVVKQQTGRDLIINGKINLSLFPWVGLELNKVALRAASGFKEKNMMQMEKMQVRLAVLPLLKKEIEVAKIVLDGLTINLSVDKQGKTSWQDLIKQDTKAQSGKQQKQAAKEGSPATSQPAQADVQQTQQIPKLVLGGLAFTNANVHFTDLSKGTSVSLKDFQLIIGRFESAKPFDMDMAFRFENQQPRLAAQVALKGRYQANLAKQQFQIDLLRLKVKAQGEMIPAGEQNIQLDANAKIDLPAAELQLNKLRLKVANVVINGQTNVTQFLSSPVVNGKLQIKPFNLRDTMNMLAMSLPEMADKQTLTEIAANMDFVADMKQASVQGLDLQLDQTHLTGSLSVKDFDKPKIGFDLLLSEIDVDRYLPPKKEKPQNKTEETQSEAPAQDTPIILPVEMMRQLDIKGRFTAKAFKIMNLKTRQTEIGILAKKGKITISPMKMKMYQGAMDAKAVINVQSEKPVYLFNAKFDGVQIEPLLNDFMEMDKIQGKTQANINIKTTGESVNQLKAALNGKLAFAFKDGAIKGFNLAREMRKADALINNKPFDKSIKDPKTDFSDVTMTAVINYGVLKNDDFSLKAPFLKVAGSGTVDLVNNQLDYLVKALLNSNSSAQSGRGIDEKIDFPVPVQISGKFSDIKIQVKLAEALKQRAQAEIDQVVAKEKQRLQRLQAQKQKELDAAKAKAQAELEAKKQKLAAELKAKQDKLAAEKARIAAELKAKEEAEKARIQAELKAKQDAEKKRLEEQLKNKLKSLF